MKFTNLCIKPENQNGDSFIPEHKHELIDFFEFLKSKINNPQIISKITQNIENLECFVVDSKKTQIPKCFDGVEKTFTNPFRGVAFIRDQSMVVINGEKFYKNVLGLAYHKNDSSAVKFHEFTHNMSYFILSQIKDGEIAKLGTSILVLDEKKDTYISKTGNYVDEALTDAIAKFYYENVYLKKNPTAKPYESDYMLKGVTLFGEILLGKDLSDADVLTAYLGSNDDLSNFTQNFNDIINDKKSTTPFFDFEQILKMDYDYSKCIDNVHIDYVTIIEMACKYRLLKAKTPEELNETIKFLQSLNIPYQVRQTHGIEESTKIKTILNKTAKAAITSINENSSNTQPQQT